MYFLSKSVYDHLIDNYETKLFLVEDDFENFAVFFSERAYEDWRYNYCPNRWPRSLKRWARTYYESPDYCIDDIFALRKLQQEFHVFD